ncbi:amino acid adenylation domain-containing protein [Roseivirga sp. BDSF3-8]|uniref:amino acid adenylation domain-containing protein n=1 Tax=Roseivirga sp. BDSF3-8 TaxID=3241598 RepID=UPI0035317EC6
MGLLHKFLELQVPVTPDVTALTNGHRSLTYTQFNNEANQIGCLLNSAGVTKGDVVAVAIENSIETVLAIYGILKAGAAYLPVDPAHPSERIAFMLKDAGCKGLITTSAFPVASLENGEITSLKTIVFLDDKIPGNIPEMIRVFGKIHLEEQPVENFNNNIEGEDLAYIIYTSGTTGQPKGTLITHNAAENLSTWMYESFYKPYDQPMPGMLTASVVFDASVQQLFAPFRHGSPLVVVSKKDKEDVNRFLDLMITYKVKVADITPSYLKVVLAAADKSQLTPSLKFLIIGGEALSTSLIKDFYKVFAQAKLINVYGVTESAVDSTFHEVEPETREPNIIGKPIPNTQVFLVDDNLDLVGIGEEGEICIGGAGLSKGYLNRPELTARKFVDHPFIEGVTIYRTGDLGMYDEDGNIHYISRKDNQVKIRGYRVELGEIEEHIKAVRVNKQPFEKKEIEGIRQEKIGVQRCSKCLLTHNYPGISFNAEGVCNICETFGQYEDTAKAYFSNMESLAEIISINNSATGGYDCMLLYSGGKDSSYVLYRLVEMGLKVLAFTFDNGFISQGAFENIKRMTDSLGVDSIISTAENMNEIFVESLNSDHTVCSGCFQSLTAVSTRIAADKGIKMIFTGLSRGQIFETKLEGLLKQGIVDPAEIEDKLLMFRKMYHSKKDRINDLLDVSLDDAPFEEMYFLDFFRYDHTAAPEIRDFLKERDEYWRNPKDTGFCSSNCMINDIGICIHSRERSYHNYDAPTSWDIRMGLITREDGMHEVTFAPSHTHVNNVLQKIGYLEQKVDDAVVVKKEDKDGHSYLAGYVAGKSRIPATIIKSHLRKNLPEYMVPNYIIHIPEIPLNTNGKVDYKRLPDPVFDIAGSGEIEKPSTAEEKLVYEIIRNTLKLEEFSITKDLFQLGLDSIRAIHIASELLNKGYQIDVNEIFLSATVKELSQKMRPAEQETVTEEATGEFSYDGFDKADLDKLF